MKILPKCLFSLAFVLCAVASYAGDASNDSARHYKSYPEQFDGRSVSIDCTHVSRINQGPQVEGVAFFVAHTFDEDNDRRGGSIVVAVVESQAASLVKKFGNTPEIDRRRGENSTESRLDSKRLRGTFHQLTKGTVYIDYTGDAHQLILNKIENAESAIRKGDGIPSGHGGHMPKKKKRF